MDVKYPDVAVRLSGTDGSAFSIIGRVAGALRREVSREAAKEFSDAAFECGSYDQVLQLCMRTVDVS